MHRLKAAFFNYYLKNKGQFSMPEALMYDSGSLGWSEFNTWPPKQSRLKKYYLQAENTLSPTLPFTGWNTRWEHPAYR